MDDQPKTMTVKIVDRHSLGTSIYDALRTVTIKKVCPRCGGPRGTPYMERFYENGQFYFVHCWRNPCGHVDFYPDVIREAEASEVAA